MTAGWGPLGFAALKEIRELGYPAADLDLIPAESIDSFAGVGYFLDLAALADGACKVRTARVLRLVGKKISSVQVKDGYTLSFRAEKGQVYDLIAL